MYDVAQRAGLSIGTVSRYVNARGYVGEQAREKIAAAITALGYVPNNAARSLTTKRTGLLGFLTSDLVNPFTAQLVHDVQADAFRLGHVVVTSGVEEDEQRALDTLAVLRSHHVDGLVVALPRRPALDAQLLALARGGVPVVVIGRDLDPPITDRVTTVTRDGAVAAVTHLLDLGHRRIAFAGAHSVAAGRRAGYLDTLAAAGLPATADLVVDTSMDREGGVAAAHRLLDLPDPPTAVFAVNDAMALGILQAAHERGIGVPERLSVVGFDDVDLAAHATPPLTTVSQPIDQIARHAVRLLTERLRGEAPTGPVLVRLPCQLTVRGSTAAR